jgi:hypothetical protein
MEKITGNLGDLGYFLMISMVDLDNLVKITSAILLGGLVAAVKIQDYRLKKREIQLKDLEIKNEEKKS